MKKENLGVEPLVKTELDLRHMFIAMLFAFAIENVFSTVLEYTFGSKAASLPLLTIILHAIFLVFVIVSSWIKWSETSKGASLSRKKSHAILTIDILILFVYFLMVSFIAEDIGYMLIANLTMAFLYLLWDFTWNDIKPNDFKTIKNKFSTYKISLYFFVGSLLLLGVSYIGFDSRSTYQVLLIFIVVYYRYRKG